MMFIKLNNIIMVLFLAFTWGQTVDWDSDIVKTSLLSYKAELVSDGYVLPWGMSFLPDGDLIVSDISGKIYQIKNGINKKVSIRGIPQVFFRGQGGLLDIEVDPNFNENNFIYFSFSDIVRNTAFTSIARAQLINNRLINLKIIFKTDEIHYSSTPIHFGSRIVIDNEYIYFSIGDRGEREKAQNPQLPHGKIHRLYLDGTVPDDNPFLNDSGENISVWCYGNRNPQGLAMSENGKLWELEHGPKGGDELNIIRKGINYGWPIITYGVNYDGTDISYITHKKGMEQPVWYWTPSIAVCGMKFYYGEPFKAWEGNILVTSLKFEYLERLVILNGKKIDSEIIYTPGSRVRDVEVGPDGNIYVALEDPGRIVRLTPIY